MLYEDELADNGITMLSCKIRVMPSRLLLLARFFMRLDNVLLRLRDTRVYVDFETEEVIREYVAKEEAYEKVCQVSVDFFSLIFEHQLTLGSCWPFQEMISRP
jgi:type 2A phosphatase activator TIP41